VIALHVGHARWERGLTWLVDLGTGVVPVVAISRSLGVDQAVVRWLRHSSVHLIDTYLPDIQELYQLADVYVFPVRSKHSASAAPLSVLEAMACNLPVVSTPFGALPHMVSERAGLFFAEDQPRFRSAVATASALSPGQVRTRQQVLRYDWAAAADTVFASALTLCRRT
jgi:glycosyltransferase involved in cell wall biosynthesis